MTSLRYLLYFDLYDIILRVSDVELSRSCVLGGNIIDLSPEERHHEVGSAYAEVRQILCLR